MSKKCACKKSAECEECPEWIFTFADLVMLMMGFFVILWVLKPNPTKSAGGDSDKQFVKVAAAIRDAFDYVPDPRSKDPVDEQMMLMNKFSGLRQNGPSDGGHTTNEQTGPKGDNPEVTSIRPAKHVTEGGRLIFEPGSAELTPQTMAALDQTANLMRGHRNLVMVKGHTSLDDLPDGATAAQKLDLSLRRAQAAADYLTGKGVDPPLIRVQGCSTFEPLTQRQYTADAQRLNRRVEVEATNTLVDELGNDQPTAAISGDPTTRPAAASGSE